jgi:hypothetical protein
VTISLSDIRDSLSPVQRAVLDAGTLQYASGEWLKLMARAFIGPDARSLVPRTALHLLGPWAPPTKTASVRVTYGDGREVDCDAAGLVTGEWILYLPEGQMTLNVSEETA